mmetsp:Transcript_58076/g.173328  ORF Transcript_58076/g.173328 Transcript_58076/m.173328 type:complete len:150 (-) Transcript_58076:266-715(-)
MATSIAPTLDVPNRSMQPSSPATPTFSVDRARLAASHPDGKRIVNSYTEARSAMERLAVTTPGSPLRRRVKLDTDEDWKIFIDSSLGKGGCGEERDMNIDLEAVLKRCYEVAFYMPPSPSASTRRTPEFSAQTHAAGVPGRGSPTPLTI